MVTIEQKLTLFSKLLNQDIKEEMDEKFAQLDKEYEKRMAQSKFNADQEANEIIEEARRRAEIRKVELISRGRLSSKKEMMQVKEALIEQFMKALEEKVSTFTNSKAYLSYLEKNISLFKELGTCTNPLEVYLTQRDYEKNRLFIEAQLTKLGIEKSQLSFKVDEAPILGGLVVVDTQYNTRMDGSLRAVIEEAKEQIVEKLSNAMGEVGEEAHE